MEAESFGVILAYFFSVSPVCRQCTASVSPVCFLFWAQKSTHNPFIHKHLQADQRPFKP
jgi:hypothetical protein